MSSVAAFLAAAQVFLQVLVAGYALGKRQKRWAIAVLLLPVVGWLAYAVMQWRQRYAGSTEAQIPPRPLHERLLRLEQSGALEHVLDSVKLLQQQGDYAQALDLLEEMDNSLFALDIHLLQAKGHTLLQLDRYEEAHTVLALLMANHPSARGSKAHVLFARALAASGRVLRACTEYRELACHDLEARYRYLKLLKHLGDEEEAQRWLTRMEECAKTYHQYPARERRWIDLGLQLANPAA